MLEDKKNLIILWAPVLVFTILNVYLSVMTWEDVRSTIGWVKNIPQKTNFKLRHIVQYGPQTFYLAWLCVRTFSLSHKVALFIGIAYVVIMGALGEVIQSFTPSRIPSFYDVMWNLVGGLVGAAIYLLVLQISKQKKHAEA